MTAQNPCASALSTAFVLKLWKLSWHDHTASAWLLGLIGQHEERSTSRRICYGVAKQHCNGHAYALSDGLPQEDGDLLPLFHHARACIRTAPQSLMRVLIALCCSCGNQRTVYCEQRAHQRSCTVPQTAAPSHSQRIHWPLCAGDSRIVGFICVAKGSKIDVDNNGISGSTACIRTKNNSHVQVETDETFNL